MSWMKEFAQAVSEEMGLEGEITDEVMDRGAMLLSVQPPSECFDGFRNLYFSLTELGQQGTYALYRDIEGWDHQVTSVSTSDDPEYIRMFPDTQKVGRGYFVRGTIFASSDPREYGHVK